MHRNVPAALQNLTVLQMLYLGSTPAESEFRAIAVPGAVKARPGFMALLVGVESPLIAVHRAFD